MDRRSAMSALMALPLAALAVVGLRRRRYGRLNAADACRRGIAPCRVFCDGREVPADDVCEIDDVEGWAELFARNSDGNKYAGVQREWDPTLGAYIRPLAKVRVYGRIELRPLA